jgi:uncharacterized protein involved in cysteine biosynthesis
LNSWGKLGAVGLFRGFLAPFRGGLFVLRHPLKRYLLLPFLLSVCQELASMVSGSPVLGGFILAILTGVGGVVLFLIGQPLLLAVFSDTLSERVERIVTGVSPTVPFLSSAGKALVHGLLKLVLYGLALVVGLALTPAGGIGPLIGLGLGAVFLAYDGFDYPLARRGASFGAKWAFLARNPGLTIGYGVGATVLYLIPFAVFVASPFAAAGATLAYIDMEKTAPQAVPAKSANIAANS